MGVRDGFRESVDKGHEPRHVLETSLREVDHELCRSITVTGTRIQTFYLVCGRTVYETIM